MAAFQRFIVAGPAAVLRALLDIIGTDTEIAVISVVRDDDGAPERLVVSMAPERGEALSVALGPRIMVEVDQDVLPL